MPCTRDFVSCEVSVEGAGYRLWDTPGLNKASGFKMFRQSTKTIGSLKKFLRERYRCGELDLVVFCVRGGRAHEGMSKMYKIFGRTTRQFAIPVVVAITHLERNQPTMEAWWQENERKLVALGLVFDGYACLTCLPAHHRRWASQRDIRFLISTKIRRRTGSLVSNGEYLGTNSRCVIC